MLCTADSNFLFCCVRSFHNNAPGGVLPWNGHIQKTSRACYGSGVTEYMEYTEPDMEIVKFEVNDVISVSYNDPDDSIGGEIG